MPIAIAFDSGGNAATEPWIKAAKPTYPCLIDRRHIVAELYDMVNVPTAVWIDERGKIVRPSEPAGVTDAFRKMNRTNFSIPTDAMAELQAKRKAYQDAIRDWVANGSKSSFALSEAEVLRRMHTPDDSQVRAAANFRLGEYLFEKGHAEAAQEIFRGSQAAAAGELELQAAGMGARGSDEGGRPGVLGGGRFARRRQVLPRSGGHLSDPCIE